MVDVYHECSDPEATLQGLRKALRPGGRLVLVEFRGEDPEVPIKPEHKMTVKQVRREVEPQGFTFKTSLEFLPWQHIIIFEKPTGSGPKEKGAGRIEVGIRRASGMRRPVALVASIFPFDHDQRDFQLLDSSLRQLIIAGIF